MRRLIVAGAAALALLLGAAAPASATASHGSDDHWRPLAAGSEPDSNPLKGFIPYSVDYSASYKQFPYTMEWAYFPLNSVMKGPASFDWKAVDSQLAKAASRGHQVAMRFYLDYPGRDSGIPKFLLDEGLKTHAYKDYDNTKSVIPNYNDPNLLKAIDAFTARLGKRYDGDAKIGFLQVGLIGFWGEWHTYPYDGETIDGVKKPDYMPTAKNQTRVLNDFVKAFTKTRLQVRNPEKKNAALPIGYHDDSFAVETLPIADGWHFMNKIKDSGVSDKWKTQPIGGELRPEIQFCIFSTKPCPVIEEFADNDFAGSVAATHVSWLLNQHPFEKGYSADDRVRALAGAKSMGYSFRVTDALVPENASNGGTAEVGVAVSNVGIAPFYYRWPFKVALLDQHGRVVRSATTGWDVRRIASGESKRLTASLHLKGVERGVYTVATQVANPLAGGAPIRFANAAQDHDRAGWLTIGSTTVK